jgi:hypothetical protein
MKQQERWVALLLVPMDGPIAHEFNARSRGLVRLADVIPGRTRWI